MKKIYIALAVVATAMLVSCEREKDFGGVTPLGENEIGFVLQGVSTRSMEEVPRVMKGETIPVGTDNMGNAFFLEETIEELNPSPATKGAPAYTVNVGNLYPTMGVYAENLGDATYVLMDEDMYEHKGTPNDPNNENGWRYHHNYAGSPWPNKTTPVDFYLRMPANDDGIVVPEEGDAITYSSTNKSISFDYVSPLTGAEQADILFGQTTLTKSEHDGYLPNGAPVLMYHALTGVKFRVGNDNSGSTKTIITKVEFEGLASNGHCIITPSTGSVVWTPNVEGVLFSQEFAKFDYSTVGDNSYSFADAEGGDRKGNFGESWYSAAADKNLNDEDGSMTFWFIPQLISEDVKLYVTFCVKTPDTSGETGGGMVTHTIDFGKVLAAKNVEWKAGQLRTYTLMPQEVDVEIYDTMAGNEKTNLHVTNIGNVHEYVRMTFLGNWYDGDGNIVVGYKYSLAEEGLTDAQKQEMVLPWYGAGYPCTDPNDLSTIDLSKLNDDTYSGPRVDPYGYFDDSFLLAVLPDGGNWIRASGGYYYKKPIGPGEKLNPQTQALFKSYTLTDTPTIYVPSNSSDTRSEANGVHLVMEVSIQAILAPMDDEGTTATKKWYEAWYDATKNRKLNPEVIPSSWEVSDSEDESGN